MWVTVHLYAGLALTLLPLPLWALVLVMIGSHVVLDVVPHWDYTRTHGMPLWASLDFVASLATVLIGTLAFGVPLRVALLGVLAAAPDFDVLVRALRRQHGAYWFPSHWRRFPHGEAPPLPGIAVQIAVVIASGVSLALVGGW